MEEVVCSSSVEVLECILGKPLFVLIHIFLLLNTIGCVSYLSQALYIVYSLVEIAWESCG